MRPKMQLELQTVQTLIRLLLSEQSDLGLHCLPRPICPKLRIITVHMYTKLLKSLYFPFLAARRLVYVE